MSFPDLKQGRISEFFATGLARGQELAERREQARLQKLQQLIAVQELGRRRAETSPEVVEALAFFYDIDRDLRTPEGRRHAARLAQVGYLERGYQQRRLLETARFERDALRTRALIEQLQLEQQQALTERAKQPRAGAQMVGAEAIRAGFAAAGQEVPPELEDALQEGFEVPSSFARAIIPKQPSAGEKRTRERILPGGFSDEKALVDALHSSMLEMVDPGKIKGQGREARVKDKGDQRLFVEARTAAKQRLLEPDEEGQPRQSIDDAILLEELEKRGLTPESQRTEAAKPRFQGRIGRKTKSLSEMSDEELRQIIQGGR